MAVVMPSWLRGLLTETVTVRPETTTTDSLGNTVPGLGAPVTEPAVVQPLTSSEDADPPISNATHRMIALPNTVATTNARVTWNGQTYDVLAPPLVHRHPAFGVHHTTVFLKLAGGGYG